MDKYNTGIRSARDNVPEEENLINICHFLFSSELLKHRIEADKRELKKIKQELALMDGALLRIHKDRDRYRFGRITGGNAKEQGISDNAEKIYELARRTVVEEQAKIVGLRIKKIQTVVDSYEEARYEERIMKKVKRYNQAGLDLSRILFTKEQNEWIDQSYSPNPFHPEHLKYSTNGNLRMRSMSETRIGNMVESVGLPYRYDDIVYIENPQYSQLHAHNEGPFRESYFSDFKFPNLLGGITIHEHLGAFQIDGYGDGSLKRLNDYHNFTVIELQGRPVKHEEFTWSFENDVRDEKALNKLLLKILIPGLV